MSLIDCLSEKPAYGANAAALEYDPELPRYVRITDIRDDGRLSSDDPKSLGRDAARGNMLEPGDIIIARSGASVGKSYLHRDGCNFAYAGYLIRFRPDFSMVLPEYVHTVLQSALFRRWLNGMRREGAQPNVNAKEYGSFRFPLPPLSEQRRIATILRTWDEAIDKLGRLRMAKSRRRRGVMRALLTAKLRLLGSGHRPWRVVRLGEIAEVIVSSVDKKTKSSERPVRLCNYTDVYACHTIRPRMGLMKASATSTEIEKCRLRVGDVVITKDSEDPNDIAVPAVVEETAPDLVCGYHLAIIRPGPAADGPFLKYYFDLPGTRAYFASRANGATRFGLTVGSIEGAVIRIPELAEQRRIAEVLRTCDEAIATISRQIDSVAGQKRGLQQKLTL